MGNEVVLADSRSGHGLVCSPAGAVVAKLLAHDIDDILGHQTVRSELAADDRDDAIDAVARAMVEDAHTAGHVAGIGRTDSLVLE